MGREVKEQSSYSDELGQLEELDAWQGYEFWSAQLESLIEWLDEVDQPSSFNLVQIERKERQSDVLPF
ncbi:MAG TPA: hypothetical protein VNN73_18770 [Blastocatellia bacterium]|nr:hypothetical protein [Blastocatellia bacterium]